MEEVLLKGPRKDALTLPTKKRIPPIAETAIKKEKHKIMENEEPKTTEKE